MDGQAAAPAAGTVLNALATGTGSAFAIDAHVEASVSLEQSTDTIRGAVADVPDADTRLIERCVECTLESHGPGGTHSDEGTHGDSRSTGSLGGSIETDSEIPLASGLKSSSAAANATVLATLDALEVADSVSSEAAAKLGVQAARDVGVTVTGAYDDASASMLGGVTVTDNTNDELLARDAADWNILVWTPDEQAFSADADVERCERIAGTADVVAELALDGRYREAMTINGLAYSAALDFPTEPAIEALAHVDGVSLSGTGPSYVAVGEPAQLEAVSDHWSEYDGTTWRTATNQEGAETL